MDRHPSVAWQLDVVHQLTELLTHLKANARQQADEYNLVEGDRGGRKHYHEGRADAFDVVLDYCERLSRLSKPKHP